MKIRTLNFKKLTVEIDCFIRQKQDEIEPMDRNGDYINNKTEYKNRCESMWSSLQ